MKKIFFLGLAVAGLLGTSNAVSSKIESSENANAAFRFMNNWECYSPAVDCAPTVIIEQAY